MRTVALALCFAVVTTSCWCALTQEDKPATNRAAQPIRVSKETTWATEPLNEQGRVDYATFLNEHFGRGVTPETNALVELCYVWGPPDGEPEESAEFFRMLGVQPPPEEGDYLIDCPTWLEQHPEIEIPNGEAERLVRVAWNACEQRPWKTVEFPFFAAWLKAMDAPLSRAARAIERPHFYLPLTVVEGVTIIPLLGYGDVREVARTLKYRAMLKLGEGQTLEAWKDLIACHRLGRLVGQGPTIIQSMTGFGIEELALDGELRLLAESKLSPSLISGLRRMLQTLPARGSVRERHNYTHRCETLEAISLLASGDIQLMEWLGYEGESTVCQVVQNTVAPLVDWNAVLKTYNQRVNDLDKCFSLPPGPARTAKMAQYYRESGYDEKQPGHPLSRMLRLLGSEQFLTDAVLDLVQGDYFESWERDLAASEDQIEQRWRMVHVAMALAAYRADSGMYPESLDQLVPKHLSAVPEDVFQAKPLSYERTLDGYRCYSVGIDQASDDDDTVVRMPPLPLDE